MNYQNKLKINNSENYEIIIRQIIRKNSTSKNDYLNKLLYLITGQNNKNL